MGTSPNERVRILVAKGLQIIDGTVRTVQARIRDQQNWNLKRSCGRNDRSGLCKHFGFITGTDVDLVRDQVGTKGNSVFK